MMMDTHQEGEISVLVPTGRVGTIEIESLRRSLKSLLSAGRGQVVVDLQFVPELSWSAIGALVEKSKEFRSNKGEIKLSGLNESLASTFRALGAHKVVDLYDSEESALKSFKPAG